MVSLAPETKEEGHVTYSFGRRVCVGKHVANNSLFINFAMMLWACTIEPGKDKNGSGQQIDGEDGEGLGTRTGRVVISLIGTDRPLIGLAVQIVWLCVGIGDGSAIIDLFEFIDGVERLSKLYGVKERRARRRRGRGCR